MQIGIDAVGCGTAQKVYFVRIGGSDQQICIPDARLLQDAHGGAVSLHGHYIHLLHAITQYLLIGVDQGDVAALCKQLLRQGNAHLTGTGNDNVHTILSYYVIILGEFCPL
jgi:hypothetical protein